jgi:lysophospholipase L1-like esterase
LTRALLLAGGALCLLAAAEPHVFTDGTERAVQRWMDQHQGYVERARAGGIDLLFIGDSLTYAWNFDGSAVWASDFAPLGAVNFGIGGDRTSDLLWRIENGEVEGSGAKTVVLEVGTNDLAIGTSPEATADGIAAAVRAIRARLPHATVVVMSVLPRGPGDGSTPIRKLVARVNERLAKLDDGKRVRYLDFTPAFVDVKGAIRPELYHPDLIHLSAEGYRAWSDTLRPALARFRS